MGEAPQPHTTTPSPTVELAMQTTIKPAHGMPAMGFTPDSLFTVPERDALVGPEINIQDATSVAIQETVRPMRYEGFDCE